MNENDPDYIEWRDSLLVCKNAITKTSNNIDPEYLDERWDEILAAPAMAELMRRGIVVVKGQDNNSIDIPIPNDMPNDVKNFISKHGKGLASTFLGSLPVKQKDQMVDIGIAVMLCCQLLMTKICTELTTEDDRVLMAAASAEVIQDTLIAMLKVLEEKQSALNHSVTSIS